MRPPVTEHLPLHSKSLCKNMASATGGAKKNAPNELRSQTERPKNYSMFNYSKQLNLISAILLDNLVSFYK